MFCSAQLSKLNYKYYWAGHHINISPPRAVAGEPEGQKLTKLLSLWESKGNFFDACVISKLRCPESSMKEYNTNLEATHKSAVNALKQTTKATLDKYLTRLSKWAHIPLTEFPSFQLPTTAPGVHPACHPTNSHLGHTETGSGATVGSN